ncbi:IS1 family transposase [Escherichia coli]|uniref:IS1 family transposase n=1 Tax=Escherichia coli TaxID=562 RepID=A0A6G4C3R8_ECOLX|nr:IS1 family transposase [Escherichia coli]EKU1041582.1 IS1 family transposase [Klebsiella pneumoniae]EME9754097.1 IS1 family transposase [Serratia marcescens]MBW4235300.1 IS1 family transposase [Enterobacter roggenkampii]NTX86164.1 IS1 family transposase [Citrobacter youngae]PLC60281.1 hypothetical protein B9P82_25995 [Citrobacter sp. L55]POU78505.1 hypothetical protein C3387_10285 [Leclercia sp. LSNIH6]POW53250.1 hypothetical protein C3406_07530 [Leclercia sp. LSNIH8]QHX04963.1 IS1 famil
MTLISVDVFFRLFGLLMVNIDVVCPRCSETNGVIRNGHSGSGAQLYRCKYCLKTFQLSLQRR